MLLEDLVEELGSARFGDDAVCYVLCRDVWGGTIGQLTHDLVDPGFVNRASGATEGFNPHDVCGSVRRKNRGMATAVASFAHAEFLRRHSTGTLAQRAEDFETALVDLIEQKLTA